MQFRAVAATIAFAVGVGVVVAPESKAATIFVNHDEWTLSDVGFNSAPDAGVFVANLVAEMGPRIHAYSTNFSYTGSQLATAMMNAGANYTWGTGFAFTLENISDFDAIFLGGLALDAAGIGALSSFVAAGGSVYIAGGTATIAGGAEGEANAWNAFLAPFDVQMGWPFNGVAGNVSVFGDSLFDGVSALYQNNGNPLSGSSVFCCGDLGGLFAVYRTDGNGPDPTPVPEPTPGVLLLPVLAGLVVMRRRYLKA